MIINTKYIFLSACICYFLLFGQNTDGMMVPATGKITVSSLVPIVCNTSQLQQTSPQKISSQYNAKNTMPFKSNNNYNPLVDKVPLYTINLPDNCQLFKTIQKTLTNPIVLNKAIQWFNKKRSHLNQMLDCVKNSKAVILQNTYQSQELQIQLYYAFTYIASQYVSAQATNQLLTNTKKQKKDPDKSTKENRSEKKPCKKEQENATSSELKSVDEPELEKNNLENGPTNNQPIPENETLKKQIEDLGNQLRTTNQKLILTNQALKDLKTKYAQQNKTFCNLVNLRNEVIEKQQEKIEAFNKKKDSLINQANIQESMLNTLTEENKTLHVEKQNLTSTQQELLTQKTNLEQKVINLEKENNIQTAKLVSQQNRIDTLEEEKKRLSQELLDGKKTLAEKQSDLLILEKSYKEIKTNLLHKIETLEKDLSIAVHQSKEEQGKNRSLQLENNELHTIVKNLKENLDLIKKDQENITQLLHCIAECMKEDSQDRKEDLADAQQKTEATIKIIFSKDIKKIKKESQDVHASLEAIAKILEEDVLNTQKDTDKIQQKYDLTKYLLYLAIAALILQTTYVYNQNSTVA